MRTRVRSCTPPTHVTSRGDTWGTLGLVGADLVQLAPVSLRLALLLLQLLSILLRLLPHLREISSSDPSVTWGQRRDTVATSL